jgi:DNA repair exonuclease SbcCD ATPase subunit
VIPVEVTLSHFLGYDDSGGQGYRFDFREHRLWSISGDNGAGKSAIFDAITYVLFGRHRGGASRDEELLRKGAASMECSFSFSHKGRLYRAKRTLKKRVRPRSGGIVYERACQLDWYDGTAGAWRAVPETTTVSGLEEHVRTSLLGFDYDTFISSVLLVQGDSDKLIRAAARDRFNYLAGILDLRQYRRLEERARGRAGTYRAQHELLARALGDSEMPTEQQVGQAQARDAEQAAAAKTAESRAREVAERLLRVVDYHRLAEHRGKVAAQAESLADAQRHAAEIRADVSERRELSAVLPRLRDAQEALARAEAAEALASAARERAAAVDLEALERRVEGAEGAEREGRQAHGAAEAELRRLRQERRELEGELGIARRLAELDTQLAGARARIADLEHGLEGAGELRARRARLDSIWRAGSLIRTYSDARVLQAQILAAGGGEEGLATSLSETARRQQEAEARVEPARLRLSAQQSAAGRVEGQLQAARHELDERRAAGAEGTCSHCGQRVPAEHIRGEIGRCETRVSQLTESVRKALAEAEATSDELAALEASLPGLRKAEREAEDRWSELQGARAQLERLQSDEAWADLPEDCRRVLVGPAGEIEAGLGFLRTELGDRTALAQRCIELDRLVADLASQQDLVEGWQAERTTHLAALSQQRATEVVARAKELDGLVAPLEREEQKLAGALSKATQTADAARGARAEAVATRQREGNAAEVQSTVAEGCRNAARTALAGVDQRFLPADGGRIATVEAHLEQLADAEERLGLLEEAERKLEGLKGELREIDRTLSAVPEDDRVSPEDAEAERDAAGHEARAAEECARLAREQAAALAHARADWLDRQRQAEELRRAHLVWDRLARLLGRSGIQLALLKRDLAEIEKLANVLLGKISNGALQLAVDCVPGRGGAEEIVFRCVDGASADEPLDVAFLSGGQKFRVAVALAAGIGQYVGLGGAMPSQIIDEGFGSLDEVGRREMLEAIREMSQHFERIIVVSHTESFHDPALFPARYELRKDGRRTLVSVAV